MATTTAFPLRPEVEQGIIQYHRTMSTLIERQWNFRERMRAIDLAYMREIDRTKEQVDNQVAHRNGDTNRIQNVTIPVIKPQVDSAVDYQAAVFLTDVPLFGVVSDPQYIEQAKQLQALIEENATRGNWVREFLLFFNDCFKYNLGAVECKWDKVVTAALETDLEFEQGKQGKPKQIIWSGNCVKRWDMYNTFWDTRVSPFDVPTKAEFCGHTELMSRIVFKEFVNKLDNVIIANIAKALESPSLLGTGDSAMYGASYFLPRLYDGALMDPDSIDSTDWISWLGLSQVPRKGGRSINSNGLYEVSHMYARIIPSDFGMAVPQRNTPQVWKFVIVNHAVVIHAERQTNAHEKIPVFFGSPNDDGLGYQTKSLADDARPFQEVASALMNSVLHGRRRAATDRVLYDPSRIDPAQINNPNPSAKIPVRPRAFGTEISKAVFLFPYRDDQAGLALSEIERVVFFGNTLNGQNPARQGQFVKGNKTDGQWESVMSNATSKDQRSALILEAQVFTPLKEVLKLNYLQYQAGSTVYSQSNQQTVQIDPVALRNAVLNFKVTDGLLPKDKLMSTEARKVAMQVIGSSQVLAGGYNIGPLFSYIMRLENVNLTPFEKSPAQLAYEQALQVWQMSVQMSVDKGVPFNVPQPTPQQYGYDPNQQIPSNQVSNPAQGPTPGVQ